MCTHSHTFPPSLSLLCCNVVHEVLAGRKQRSRFRKGRALHCSGASWDTYLDLITLSSDCSAPETDKGLFLPECNLVSLHIPTLVSLERRGPGAADFRPSARRQRWRCDCVIRIVNEVNSSAHLTSLQLSLV